MVIVVVLGLVSLFAEGSAGHDAGAVTGVVAVSTPAFFKVLEIVAAIVLPDDPVVLRITLVLLLLLREIVLPGKAGKSSVLSNDNDVLVTEVIGVGGIPVTP